MNQVNPRPTIYVDMDGVVCNFLKAAKARCGESWESHVSNERKRWRNQQCFEVPGFWENIPPMDDMPLLWNYVRQYDPHILTAMPHGEKIQGRWTPPSEVSRKLANEGKWAWCQKHFPELPFDHFHCVRREHKRLYATKAENGHVVSNILIDDTPENIVSFIGNRGHAILHTSAADTISKLREYSV